VKLSATLCQHCQQSLSEEEELPNWAIEPDTNMAGSAASKRTNSPLNDNDSVKCPNCSSKELSVNKKGYGLGKAAAGLILTGGIGLMAGLVGKNKLYGGCHICGHTWNI
jgi:hypothetical protein